jgi:DNA mismatch repair protein MutL
MNLESNQTRKIHLLPEHIVDQIKAGEVVERPSALLKELLENSIDAGSSRIDIQIRDNGLELISLEDNGEGMDVEDLPYAFCRHATSKISKFDDLYRLHSYGFRGEALASICSISRVTCTSSPKKDPSRGGKIIFYGGKQEDWSPLPSSTHGTSLFVKDLFYNTPARLKFLKSKTAEKNALQRVFNGFLLTQPEVSLSIKWDDKEKSMFPCCPKEDIRKRVARVFFKKNPTEETLSQIAEVSVNYEGTFLKGFYSKTTTKGASGKAQYFFVNDRMFVDKALHLAFMRAAENVWPHGEFGHYCFFIDLPPDQVDVNVHPGKIHVKFQKPSVIFGLISNSIEKKEREESNNVSNEQVNYSSDSLWETYSNPLANTSQPRGAQTSEPPRGLRVFSLNESFIIHKPENDAAILVNLNIFVKTLLELCLIRKIELVPTPLLIGEAFHFPKGSVDKHLPKLAELGIDIDRVDNKTLILRAAPSLLTTLNLQSLISSILISLNNNDEFDIKKTLSSTELQLNLAVKPVRFEALWNKLSDNKSLFKSSIKILDEDSLKRFFTGKF